MITSYSTLQAAVADFLNRDDLTAMIPTFIQMAEARVSRELRHWRMEVNATYSADAQYEALPSDWVETIRLYVPGGNRLGLVSHAEIEAMRTENDDVTGAPRYYALVAGQIETYPTPSEATTVNHLYYGKIPALSDSDTSNWLLDEAPDVYLYGSLLHSAPYLVEDQRLPIWASLHDQAIMALQAASDRARHSGTGLKMKVR